MSAFDPKAFFTVGDPPPIAQHMGWTFIDADATRGWIKIGFTPKEEFINFGGTVQGGLLTAMLDDTMGPAAIVKAGEPIMIQSIDLHTHFFRPVSLGPITVEAECTQLGKTIAYLEGKLFDQDGTLCARATSSARIRRFSSPDPSPNKN